MIHNILTCNVPSKYTNIIYPLAVTEAAVERFNKLIVNRSSVGMLGSPFDHFPMEVDLSRVSHIVTSMYIKHGTVKATVKVLSAPYGIILQQLLDMNLVRLSPIMTVPSNAIAYNNIVTDLSIIGTSFVHNDNPLQNIQTKIQHDLFEEL